MPPRAEQASQRAHRWYDQQDLHPLQRSFGSAPLQPSLGFNMPDQAQEDLSNADPSQAGTVNPLASLSPPLTNGAWNSYGTQFPEALSPEYVRRDGYTSFPSLPGGLPQEVAMGLGVSLDRSFQRGPSDPLAAGWEIHPFGIEAQPDFGVSAGVGDKAALDILADAEDLGSVWDLEDLKAPTSRNAQTEIRLTTMRSWKQVCLRDSRRGL